MRKKDVLFQNERHGCGAVGGGKNPPHNKAMAIPTTKATAMHRTMPHETRTPSQKYRSLMKSTG
jgi:hypothetical protein